MHYVKELLNRKDICRSGANTGKTILKRVLQNNLHGNRFQNKGAVSRVACTTLQIPTFINSSTNHEHGERAYFYPSLFHKHIFSHPSKHLPLSFTYKQVHTKGLSPPPWWPPPLLVTQLGTCFLSHWIPIVFSSIHKAQLRQWVHSVFGPRLKLVTAGYCRARGQCV